MKFTLHYLSKKSLYYTECWITALLMYNPNPLTNKKNEHYEYRSLMQYYSKASLLKVSFKIAQLLNSQGFLCLISYVFAVIFLTVRLSTTWFLGCWVGELSNKGNT